MTLIEETVQIISEVLGTFAYSKVDFILNEDDTYICSECDSLPRLYPDSDLAIEAEAVGIPYDELCDRILRMSLVNRSFLGTSRI